MKTDFLYTIHTIALGTLLLGAMASCGDEALVEGAGSAPVLSTLTATIAEQQEAAHTRTCVDMTTNGTGTTAILWQQNDSIGVYGTSGTANALFFNQTAGNSATAKFVSTGRFADMLRCAYYPYSADAGTDPTALAGQLPAVQPFCQTTGRLVGDYKWGVPSSTGATDLVFRHLFSMLNVTINATGTSLEGETLQYIELTVADAAGNPRDIAGRFTFSALDGTWGALADASQTIRMPWTDQPALTSGQTYTGFLSVMPTVEQGDVINVSVVTNAHRASFHANCLVDFAAETIYNVPLELRLYAEQADRFGYEEVELPVLKSFSFEVAHNAGKLLDNQLKWNSSSNDPYFDTVTEHVADIDGDTIRLMIPYLYNFKLVPTFTAPDGAVVSVDGTAQVSGQSEVDFTQPVTYTVSASGEERQYVVCVTNTGLPVVVLQQSGSGDFSAVYKDSWSQIIGGDARNKFVDFMVRGKDTEWVEDDVISVYNANGTVDLDAAPCGARLRGNTTQDYPKKPFAIKLKKKSEVLGMPTHKRWVLLANWLDHSMMRNTVAFDVAHTIESAWKAGDIEQGIPWNVHGQNVEFVIDGHHVGNYYLCEQIKIDENRLNIQEAYEDVANPTFETCGYLLELDNNYDETYKFITPRYSVPFMFKDDLPDETIFEKVKAKILGIEENIYQGDFAAAYEDLDIYSVIDQLFIWELAMNREYVEPRSVYYFMNGDGKLSAGPVWDFDRATFQNTSTAASQGSDRVKPYDEWIYWLANPTPGITSASGFGENTYSGVFYPELMTDPTFTQAVQARWAKVYPYLQGMEAQIRAHGQKLAKSYEVNNAMWPTTKSAIQAHKSGFSDWSGDENIADYADVIANFAACYQARLEGMNTLITQGKFTK